MNFLTQIIFISLILVNISSKTESISENSETTVCLSNEEMSLFNQINEYRSSKGLDKISLSASLSLVAQTHSKDLSENYTRSKTCNMHSWSKEGTWSSCCYTSDHKQAECMWNKPRELTSYQGDGFEIAFSKYFSDDSDPKLKAHEALAGWKKSAGHNMVMINKGSFKKMKWECMGVGMNKGYATVWFGAEVDVSATPGVCE